MSSLLRSSKSEGFVVVWALGDALLSGYFPVVELDLGEVHHKLDVDVSVLTDGTGVVTVDAGVGGAVVVYDGELVATKTTVQSCQIFVQIVLRRYCCSNCFFFSKGDALS